MSKKNIFIEPDEEIVSIIDKIIDNPEDQFNLVIPRGAQIWQSSINLKLLKREASLMEKDITLVVSDDLGKEIAESVGFNVVKDKDFSFEFVEEEQEEEQEEESPTVIPPDISLTDEEEPETFKTGAVASLGSKLDENKDNMIDILAEEMANNKEENKLAASKIDKNNSFKKFKKKRKSIFGLDRFSSDGKKMMDIVNPKEKVKINLFSSSARNKFFSKKIKEKKEIKIKKKTQSEDYSDSIQEEIVHRSIWSNKFPKFFGFFIGIAVIIAGIVGYLVLPSAEVTIFPKTEVKSLELSLTGSKNIGAVDSQLNKIPLKEISVRKTKSQEFLATGEMQLNERARGIITVYNEYSSEPQTLVATTRFESTNGQIFRIPKSVIIPGASINEGKIIASSLDVEVIADQPGEEYNIGPNNFIIPGFKGSPKFAAFYGISKKVMTGGSTKKVKIVLKDDLEQAEKILIDELKNEINASLRDQIPEDYKMLTGGAKENLTDVFPTAKENDQVDKFTLEIEIVVQALLYKDEDLKSLIDSNVAAAITEDKRPLSETQKIEWQEPIEIDWQKGTAAFKLKVQEDLAFQIGAEKIKADLAGKKEIDVRKYLSSQMEIEKASVTFWPFWVKKVPSQLKKIKIIIK